MYYFAPISENTPTITLCKDQSHHIVNVKRFENGQVIRFTNGMGHLFQGTVLIRAEKKSPKTVTLSEIKKIATRQRRTQIHLLQGLPQKKPLLELIVQKTTELGIASITPILTKKSLINKQKTTHLNYDRLENIALEALKQSENTFLPRILPLTTLCNIDQQQPSNSKKELLVFLPGINHPSFKTFMDQKPSLNDPVEDLFYFIGPEEGLLPSEQTFLIEKGFKPIQFGQSILRTETAAIAAMAIFRFFTPAPASNLD